MDREEFSFVRQMALWVTGGMDEPNKACHEFRKSSIFFLNLIAGHTDANHAG